ncbi:MAG TPA: indole-3-glycerol-phosphate synthase [Candidatus Nitrosocosmicus sp.]|jgi:indole-3-glycerol phosphate synthase|nr:indole-3-glycerol-phosphate synthase [Candidatus Nitrosocosmicus sp.]
MTTNNLRFFSTKSMLKTLVKNSIKAIDDGMYEINGDREYSNHTCLSMRNSILKCNQNPLLTEIKYASPSRGTLVDYNKMNVEEIATTMEKAGAVGISILAQPHLFNGSINNILRARKYVTLPILMKDIVVSDVQIKAAKKAGADCILLIKTVFDSNLSEGSLETMAEYAKKIGLEVILETHDEIEFGDAVKTNSKSKKPFNLIGINNRNLTTLEVDLDTTVRILSENSKSNNIVISESGIKDRADIIKLKSAGADAFLIGTTLMEKSKELGQKIKELVES